MDTAPISWSIGTTKAVVGCVRSNGGPPIALRKRTASVRPAQNDTNETVGIGASGASSSRGPGTGKSHLAQAIGVAVIQQGHRVLYREAHTLVDELADAQLAGIRKATLAHLTAVPLLIVDDLGMRKLPATAAEDLLEIVMRRYERASTLLTSNRPVEDWGKLPGDTAAVTALLDRLLHHAHVLTCGPRSWRTRLHGERAACGA